MEFGIRKVKMLRREVRVKVPSWEGLLSEAQSLKMTS